MLTTKPVTNVFNMPVYTDDGNYFGNVEEAVITSNKVYGWRIKATKNSKLGKVLGGAKGVIVPHQLVKSVGEVMIISKAAVPASDMPEEEQL